MKNKYIIFGLTLLMLAACGEESIYSPENDELIVCEQNSQKQMLVFDPWEKDILIEVDEKYIPEIEATGNYFEYELQDGNNGKKIIRLSLHDGIDTTPFLTKIPLHHTSRNATSDTLYMICRSSETPDIKLALYQENIGKTLNASGSIFDNPKNPILDAKRLFAAEQMEIIVCPGSFGYGKTNMSYEEMQSSMWEEFGASAFFSKDIKNTNMLFSGSMNQQFEENSFNSNKYEFHYDTHVKVMTKLFMKTYLSSSSDPEVFFPYLTDEAIYVLNTPKHPAYKEYDNTFEGISKLYDTYGTHVLIGGIFGGRYTFLYARKENYYMESVANTASAELSAKAGSGANGTENWLQTYYRVMGQHKGTLSGAGGDYNNEIGDYIDEWSKTITIGGDATSDIGVWDASISNIDDDALMPVSYVNRDAIGNITVNGKSDNYVIPLYTLVCDSARRNAMEQYLEQYIKSKYTPIKERPRLVVADFMMKTGKNGNKEEAKTRIYKGPDGVERPYFPLVGNKYVPGDAPEGAMLDTSSDHYLVVADEVDQLWWVSLAYEDECVPVTDIKFATADYAKTYNLKTRGDTSGEGMNWPDLLDIYVCLELDTDKDPITGVGILREANDNSSWYVIASSPGTDMLKPYFDTEQCEQFKKYWGSQPVSYENLINISSSSPNQWFQISNNGVRPGNDENFIHVVYTKEPLSYPLVFQKPRQFWNREEDPDSDSFINN